MCLKPRLKYSLISDMVSSVLLIPTVTDVGSDLIFLPKNFPIDISWYLQKAS